MAEAVSRQRVDDGVVIREERSLTKHRVVVALIYYAEPW